MTFEEVLDQAIAIRHRYSCLSLAEGHPTQRQPQ